MNLQRLEKAFGRWLFRDKTGKRGGRPKFKKRGDLPSFSFSRVNHLKAACFLEGDILRIPRIGSIPVIIHRPIPDGFVLKTATITFRADGYYVSISASDETVPEPKPLDTVKSAVGIDLGLKFLLATSNSEFVPVPQIYRSSQTHLAPAPGSCFSKSRSEAQASTTYISTPPVRFKKPRLAKKTCCQDSSKNRKTTGKVSLPNST